MILEMRQLFIYLNALKRATFIEIKSKKGEIVFLEKKHEKLVHGRNLASKIFLILNYQREKPNLSFL